VMVAIVLAPSVGCIVDFGEFVPDPWAEAPAVAAKPSPAASTARLVG
jgi:hypothetical protein